MKGSKINIILNVVLLIAVIVLFVMQFGTSKNTEVADSTEVSSTLEDTPTAVATIDANMKIVYVNSDSLLKHYSLSQDVESKFESKQTQMKNRLAGEQKKLEDNYQKYMSLGQAGMLTEDQKVNMPKEIEKQDYDLKELQARLSEVLAKDYERYSMMVNDSVLNFLERYRIANDYTFIFQYANQGSGLLAVDPSLDVTKGVVKQINEEYLTKKPNL